MAGLESAVKQRVGGGTADMSTFFTGNTGRSTGPHLDLRVFNPNTNKYEDPSGYVSYLSQGDKPFNFQVTSGYGMRNHPVTGGRKMHHGIDYATLLVPH